MTIAALLVTLYGAAGVWGELTYQARMRRHARDTLSSAAFGFLILLPALAALPPWSPVRVLAWIGAATVSLIYGLRPARMPDWLWSPRFGYGYLASDMLLIMMWSLAAAGDFPAISLALPASIAALLAAGRALSQNQRALRGAT